MKWLYFVCCYKNVCPHVYLFLFSTFCYLNIKENEIEITIITSNYETSMQFRETCQNNTLLNLHQTFRLHSVFEKKSCNIK